MIALLNEFYVNYIFNFYYFLYNIFGDKMNLRTNIINENHKDIDIISSLYETAFPDDEKAPFSSLIERSKKETVDFIGYYDNDKFIGFTYLIHDFDLHYIFYFAIVNELRNQGYGTEILNILKEKYKDETIFFEIETIDENADNYHERKRRKDFYLRNGFKESGFGYYFYVDYEVMIYGSKIEPDRWHDMFITFSNGFVDVEFKRKECE